MSNFFIPNEQKQIRQINLGDVFGELWATFNIDLTSSRGKIKSSRRLTSTVSTTLSENDDVEAFAVFNGDIYAFADGGRRLTIGAERNPRISGNWTSTSGSLDIGSESDAVVFDGKMLVSLGADIASTTNGTSYDDDWGTTVANLPALTISKPHIMNVSRSGQETLFVTDGNKVHYVNFPGGSANPSVVTLDEAFTACCVASDTSATWVGTYSSEGNAYVYEIYVGEQLDGTPVARRAYKVDGTAVLSIDVLDDIPYIVTDRGHIQVFNGRGFVTVASFPFAFDSVAIDGLTLSNIADVSIDRAVHPKGMRAYGKSLLIHINTNNQLIDDLASNPDDNDDVFTNVMVNPRSPSGIWEYDSETGVINHRYSLTLGTTSKGYQVHQKSAPILITDNQFTRILTSGRVDSSQVDIFAEDKSETPYSYFITPEIMSGTITDSYETVYLKAKTLADDEAIVVKYRASKRDSQYNEIVWLNATQFTTTDTSFSNVQVGDEIEVIEGYRSGYLAHITAIEGTTTYTVTIDESIGSLNETSTIRVENWKKVPEEYTSSDGEMKQIGVGVVSPWIQYKVALKGNIELRQFISKGNAKDQI